MRLGNLMTYMDSFDEHIRIIRKNMMHVHPIGVDRLRHTVEEIEVLRARILNDQLVDSAEINRLLRTARQCLRDCLSSDTLGKPNSLPRPKDDLWTPPVLVTAVHLIFYLDISDSMFDFGGLGTNGARRKMLVEFAQNLAKRAAEFSVPTKVSLIGYADPTHTSNQPTFWQVALNKKPVGELAQGFADINRTQWKRGYSYHEEGLTCINATIGSILDTSIVNGKPTENVVILISDERQRLAGSEYPPHARYGNTTSHAQLSAKFTQYKIRSRFGIIPMKRGYSNGGAGSRVVGVTWNNDVKKLFTSTKEFWEVNKASSLDDWIKAALNPKE